jgi:hypothetical protein
VAQQGRTTHPQLSRIYLARTFNGLCGAVIAPWEIDDLPDEWLDALLALTDDLPELQSGLQQVKQIQDQIRAQYARKHA